VPPSSWRGAHGLKVGGKKKIGIRRLRARLSRPHARAHQQAAAWPTKIVDCESRSGDPQRAIPDGYLAGKTPVSNSSWRHRPIRLMPDEIAGVPEETYQGVGPDLRR